jgi:uncharacterized protein (TIGR00661 family)
VYKATQIKNASILLSALDWGFGHTTRSLVLIQKLIQQNNTIHFAGNQRQIDFIRQEIPSIHTHHLPGYNIVLSSKKGTYSQMVLQAPKLLTAIKREAKWVKNICEKETIDLIISDNRYGFRHANIPSILLTHQISLQIPLGKNIVNFFLKKQIEKFSCCWVPDYENHQLSGALSEGNLSIPKYFIGPLSRFNLTKQPPYQFDYLFLISGPKPSSDYFLEAAIALINENKLNAMIAIPYKIDNSVKNKDIKITCQPNTKQLESLLLKSKTVVARSGYTTIMDLIPSEKSFFLAPTKRQYEQIYLYKLHQSRNEQNIDATKLNHILL